jgi:hypothetical protein
MVFPFLFRFMRRTAMKDNTHRLSILTICDKFLSKTDFHRAHLTLTAPICCTITTAVAGSRAWATRPARLRGVSLLARWTSHRAMQRAPFSITLATPARWFFKGFSDFPQSPDRGADEQQTAT